MAITIFGGLITATLLDMILTPVLFLRYGEKPLARLRALQGEEQARDPSQPASMREAY